jgi:hypothetical protein
MERTFTFTEAAIGDGFRLDAENGVAHGVAVCGPVSLNGRDYPDAVRDRDKMVYDGSQVYIDHRDGERMVREWFGELRNPRTRISDRRTIADHHYPKNSAFTAEYEERAHKFPRSLGFSHVAVCQTKRVNGREVIEAITRVHSVDLVAKPATNAGISESHRATPMKLKEYAAAVAAKFPEHRTELVKFLREDMPLNPDMPADAPPVDDAAGGDDPVKAAVKTALHGLVEQFDADGLTGEELLKKAKMLVKLAEKMAGKAEETPADPAAESLKAKLADAVRENADLKADRLFAEHRVTPTNALKKAVLRAESDAERKELVESFVQARPSETPVSPARKAPKEGEETKTESAGLSWHEPAE